MTTLLYIVHVIVCIGMLPIILLQSGKGGGVSAVFGGGGAGTVFGSRGASSFLTRMTTGCAVVFMLTSFGLSLQASRQRSVVEGIAPVQAAPATAGIAGDQDAQEAGDQVAPPGESPSGSSTTSN
ncbi:MAG: preprotein translocase subunit SecG [Myxococcota bacterium]